MVTPLDNKAAIAAGDFGHWLQQTQSGKSADVPCGECNACCRASYFIHVGDQEKDALSKIPKDLIFPAPGGVERLWVMGFNESGECPMLHSESCSIYANRPQTCRDYDCRLFAAADICASSPGEKKQKAEVDQQIKLWRFSYANPKDKVKHDAVKAAAKFLNKHHRDLDHLAPTSPTQKGLASLHVHHLFIAPDQLTLITPDLDSIRSALGRAISS